MAGRGRAKRAGPVSLVGRRNPARRSSKNAPYPGPLKAVGGGYNSKIPVGPNPMGRRAQMVRQARRGR